MNLKNLFHALVLTGTALGVAHCGGGTTVTDPNGTGTTSTTFPDGGTVPDGGTIPGPGAPGGW